MSIKDLFKSTASVISNKSLSDLTGSYHLESIGIISESLLRRDQLIPNIDFTKPEQFVKYGSAAKYYEDSIKNIYTFYPWDGSKKQKQNWRNNASYLDLWMLDNEYPAETGSITIGTTFGTASVKSNGYYSTPSRVEYIKINPGLSSGSIYDTNDRVSAFSFNSENGFCVEFWMKSNTWSPDLFSASYQCIFDMGARDEDTTSSLAFGNPGGWRFSILTTGTSLIAYMDDVAGDFYLTYNNAFSFGEWNHFSINILSGAQVSIWKNGVKQTQTTFSNWTYLPVHVTFSGTIGALSTIPNSALYGGGSKGVLGSNKFSGSLDDFRFWRRSRTDKEIITNWFTTVDGGFDNDELLSPEMGFYYKFNEGTTTTSSIDSKVLDYSGRKNHATWVGYTSAGRSTSSPIENESLDPIIHTSSYRVQNLLSAKNLTGLDYDQNNNSALINLLPGYLQDEDEGEHLQNLTQILASYFDKLWLQINALSSMRDTAYFASGSLASQILNIAIQSNGINVPNILDNLPLSEIIGDKGETFNFEQSVESIKQVIYKNIYNNLIYIFKSKGTEKAVKSVFRSFGVDDELLKIKAYSNSKFEIDGSKRFETIRRKNYLDLSGKNDSNNLNGNVFNFYTASESGSIGYIADNSFQNDYYPYTFEANIVIPYTFDSLSSNYIYISNHQLSSSLFGFYEMPTGNAETSSNTTWKNNGFYLNVYVVRKNQSSQDGKFVFKYSSIINAPALISDVTVETPWYPEVYRNSKWTFAIRDYVTGSQFGIPEVNRSNPANPGNPRVMEFFALQESAGQIIHTFSNKTEHTATTTHPFMSDTACYLGALRTNFTGSVVLQTNAKFGSLRLWKDYLTDTDIYNHAYDIESFGTNRIFESVIGESNTPHSDISSEQVYDKLYIPKMEACILNWDFGKEYIPDSNGKFLVHSFRGKSLYSQSLGLYGYVSQGSNYTGLGYGFNSGSTVIEKGYAIEQKNREIQNLIGLDAVQVLQEYDQYFNTTVRPTEYFYTIENSIYSVISEEILNFFSSIDDFNNLIGEPALQYRQRYKGLDILRQIFFSKIQNTKIDFNKYISYYNWLDGAISMIIRSLFPASANVDTNLRTVVESHALERNKHVWTYQLVRYKPSKSILGVIRPLFKKFNPIR